MIIDAAGQTTNPDGNLKDMNDEQLKKAQKHFKTEDGMIKAEQIEIKMLKADEMMDKEKEGIDKDEFYRTVGMIMDTVREVYSRCMERDSNILNGVNDFIEMHTMGHLPSMSASQRTKIFDAAGIAEDFEPMKEPDQAKRQYVWASESGLESLKIEVK